MPSRILRRSAYTHLTGKLEAALGLAVLNDSFSPPETWLGELLIMNHGVRNGRFDGEVHTKLGFFWRQLESRTSGRK
jgi:hypothetical protein